MLGFLADISYGYTALFIALFPVMGFFAGVLTRWYVNASLFAYLVMCFAAFAVTALFQMARPAYESGEIIVLVRDGLIQCVWRPAHGRRALLPLPRHSEAEDIDKL